MHMQTNGTSVPQRSPKFNKCVKNSQLFQSSNILLQCHRLSGLSFKVLAKALSSRLRVGTGDLMWWLHVCLATAFCCCAIISTILLLFWGFWVYYNMAVRSQEIQQSHTLPGYGPLQSCNTCIGKSRPPQISNTYNLTLLSSFLEPSCHGSHTRR